MTIRQDDCITNIFRIREILESLGYSGVLVPSNDEYLSEWVPPFGRRLEWLLGFRGSVGLAVILRDRAGLFVDGRYTVQAKQQTAGLDVDIRDLSEASQRGWLADHLSQGQKLAVDMRLLSEAEIRPLIDFLKTRGVDVVDSPHNLVDQIWGQQRPQPFVSQIFDYPTHYSGGSRDEKLTWLKQHIISRGSDYHLLTDPEDVAWLLNVRTDDSLKNRSYDRTILPIPLTRALISAAGTVFWFENASRLEAGLASALGDRVELVDPTRFESFLEDHAGRKLVEANAARLPYRYAAIVTQVGTLRDDPSIAKKRWIKHPNEIQRAREGHHQDGCAVIQFLAWLQHTVQQRRISEIEASDKLSEFRDQIAGYRGASMPMMSASGPSGAMPHYVPSEHSNRILNDHPIYWMDSGGQYYGCSTDNTVCFALGMPEPRHIRAHTLILKGFIALSRARFPTGIFSNQLDTFARQFLWLDGMDYVHATGHGVGNFMNIHEGPAVRKAHGLPLAAPIEAGMIISNEPAYYRSGDFGIRIESHLAVVPSVHPGFLEFETLSRLPIDPRLVDHSLLTVEEIHWLADYHTDLFDGYRDCFDTDTTQWLKNIVSSYALMAKGIPKSIGERRGALRRDLSSLQTRQSP